MEFTMLLIQAGAVLLLMFWLLTGVLENLFQPRINSEFTAEVMDMARMREAYPDLYEQVAYRRIANPTVQKLLFWFIVCWETISLIALGIGFVSLLGAGFLGTDPDLARQCALIGVFCFTSIWAGFLVAGNWFCYWFGHEGAQNTHFQLLQWGVLTLILLSI